MKREILFKGKRVDNGEWVEGFYCKSYGRLNGINYDYHSIYDYEAREHYEIILETLGQYTGLTDKNGKKIFEGDIVKAYKFGDERFKFVDSITFRNGCFWFGNWNFIEFLDKFRNYEVIGNVHDGGIEI